ncbi:transmembrane protein 232 [Tiliqua scincoides]|uniref:transmembrane protein 232 n=1 Tax=Tiliqua scincoides TaxID=71010 RepID=UPI0034636239
MPLIKVPVIHRFGIVSSDVHQILQQRLLKKYLKESSLRIKKVQRNPFELTEEFIENFNDTFTENKDELILLAKKMLAGCKRKSGLSTLGCGKHVNLPAAWTEAMMLSQCKGEIHEEALEILLRSLDHAPINPKQAPVLFFIAESILHMLCYDAVQKPYLFRCEIRLSKIGFLAFLRLLLLHFFGYLEFSKEQKSRLHIGLKALAACEICYQLYPNILFTVHFMLKAGETICETVVFSETSLTTDADLDERKDGAFPDIPNPELGAPTLCRSALSQTCHKNPIQIPETVDMDECPSPWSGGHGVWSDSGGESELSRGQGHPSQASTKAPSPRVELHSGPKQFKIKPFLWHSLLVWVCVHNSCSEIDEVLKHVLFYKEQLHQKDWLESVLGLMVLGETAKLNMSCLKVLMDLVRDFISSAVSPQKQQKSNMENRLRWQWQVGYVYTNILKEICLHGVCADLQKTAFLGFCDCVKELKDDKKLRGAAFLDLMNYCPSSDNRHDLFWVIRYGVIYNLVILRGELSGVVNRDGFRNAVWRTLQKQKNREKESRVLDAVTVAEVEAKGLINPFLASKEKVPANPYDVPSSWYIGWRVATAMTHHFLPPIGPNIPLPRQPVRKPLTPLHQEMEPPVKEKKVMRLSLREELLRAGVPKYPYPDILTRTDIELRRIVDNQWQKELQLRIKLEEQLLEIDRRENQREEEERFRQIMKWRLEKLHKTTKPYELPFQQDDEDSTEESDSNRLSSLSQIWKISS